MAADLAEPLAGARPLAGGQEARPRLRAVTIAAPTVRRFLYVLLALYLVKQAIFVIAFQPFSGHDEVAHYSYIRTLATEGRVPVLPDLAAWREATRAGRDPDMDVLPAELYPYCRYAAVGWWCQPDNPRWLANPPRAVQLLGNYYPDGYQYTANHPPLYYALMAPLYWASAGWSSVAQQYLLRVAAIPFGLATVLLAYALTRALFPGDTFLGVTVPTFVAFQPQISYEAAMVNNDILAIALFSLILYLLVIGIRDRFPIRLCLALGVTLGLALLTKGTSLTAAPLVAAAVIAAVGWREVAGWIRRGLAVLVPASLLAAPWYAFLYRTYGNFDALEQIRALQYWNQPAGTFWGLLTSRDFVVMRFRETWGEFGWRDIPLDPSLLWAIAVPLIVAVGGLILYAVIAARAARDHDPSPDFDPVLHPERWQWIGLAILAAACVTAYLAVVQFGTEFALTQARYYFPVINAAALLLMLGLRTLIPRRFHPYGQGAVFGAMTLLHVLIFSQYVIPHYLSL